jgi:hypothetical protein
MEQEEASSSLQELIEYLEEEIHPKYYLIQCLRSNISFHHSKLAYIVRREIEDLFASGKIKYLYCTSTLLQGVNLPANNLFITSPNKKNIRLSPFEFGNLIGRAGRIRDSLYGSIYCIESIDTQEGWADGFLSASYEKDVLPATQKALNSPNTLISDLDKTSLEINNGANAYTINMLRQKYMKDKSEVSGYLATRSVSQKDIDAMLNLLSTTLSSVTLSSDILRLNPTIDPLLQDQLHKAISSEGVEKWVVVPNTNFYKRIKRDRLDNYNYEELSFYWQLVTIYEKLNAVFRIEKEAFFKHNISPSIAQMTYYAINWLESRSYSQIIKGDILFHAKHSNENKRIDINNDTDINKRINEIITVHTQIVTYLLVKYLKLLNDILKSIMTDKEQERYKFSLSLPTMLELGTTEPVVITLISSGINRSVALKVFDEFKKVPNYQERDVLAWLKGLDSISLKPIYIRYLKKFNFFNN